MIIYLSSIFGSVDALTGSKDEAFASLKVVALKPALLPAHSRQFNDFIQHFTAFGGRLGSPLRPNAYIRSTGVALPFA